jgi:hypothetical protein
LALGLLSAFTGLPWWLSVGVVLTAAIVGIRCYRLGRVPDSPFEIAALCAMAVVLVLAARGAGDLISSEARTYRYFATDPLVFSRIVPWSQAITVDEFEEGQEVRVSCRTTGVKKEEEVWLRLPDGTYVADAEVYQDYSSTSLPSKC